MAQGRSVAAGAGDTRDQLWGGAVGLAAPHKWICVTAQIETKKKLAINAMPTNHTSERRIAQSAT